MLGFGKTEKVGETEIGWSEFIMCVVIGIIIAVAGLTAVYILYDLKEVTQQKVDERVEVRESNEGD